MDGWINDSIQLDIVRITEVESLIERNMENMELILDGKWITRYSSALLETIPPSRQYIFLLQVTSSKYINATLENHVTLRANRVNQPRGRFSEVLKLQSVLTLNIKIPSFLTTSP